VPQDVFISNGTIAENISLGFPAEQVKSKKHFILHQRHSCHNLYLLCLKALKHKLANAEPNLVEAKGKD
jgi:hypothetical protein